MNTIYWQAIADAVGLIEAGKATRIDSDSPAFKAYKAPGHVIRVDIPLEGQHGNEDSDRHTR